MTNDNNSSGTIYSDITGFVTVIQSIIESRKRKTRIQLIRQLKTDKDLIVLYVNSSNGNQIFKHEYTKIFDHELSTAIKLTDVGFDVIFAPKGMFKREEKKFDIYAVYKEAFLIKADLKANFVPTVNAVFKQIESGARQAEHLVLDIKSSIKRDDLIDGLRSGLKEGRNVKTILLFYKKKFHNLDRSIIFSKVIFKRIE